MSPEASLARRLAASVYESLLLGALWLAAGFALLPIVTPPGVATTSRSLYALSSSGRLLSAVVIVGVSAVYCAGLWSGGRRTLAMKTWHLALQTSGGGSVGAGRALLRYALCWVGPLLALAGSSALEPLGHGRWALLLLSFNYVWALVDRDRRFLQDRLAGTRLVLDRPAGAGR